MPVTAKTMATGNWKASKSATPAKEEMSASAPTFTTKKKMGMISAGTSASGSRGTARNALPAMLTRSRQKPA
jgi:hypothetical protein